MQKTILAVALASAFSMGAACAADTNVTILQGQGTQPLLNGQYQLGGDYTINGTESVIVKMANIDLNGHNLTIDTNYTSATPDYQSAFQNVTMQGKGNLTLKHSGNNVVFSTGTSSLKADNVTLSSAQNYCLWLESTSKMKIATNEAAGVINISSKDQTAIYMTGSQTSLDITDFAELHISTTSEVDNGSAINNNGGTLNIKGGKVFLSADKRTAFNSMTPDKNSFPTSKTTFEVDELHVSANIDQGEGAGDRKVAAFAVGAGTVDVKANVFTIDVTESESNKADVIGLDVYAAEADAAAPIFNVETKKTAITGEVVAKAGTSTIKSETLQVTGDVTVKQEASMPLTFSGKDSFLTGQANIEKSTARDGDNTLAFKENAVWTVKGESSVDALVVENATVDISATDKDVTAASLTGKNGTIVLDAAGKNTLTATTNTVKELKAVASKTADYVTTEEAAKMLDRINAKGATITGEVKEGDYNGSIIVDQQGNTVTKTNTLMQDVLTLNGATTLSLNRILSNDIRKRMGDVRSAEGTTGAWARWDGGRLSGGAVENDFNTIQVGVDTLMPNQNFRVGFAGSYTNGDADFTRGSAEMDAWSLKVEGTGTVSVADGKNLTLAGASEGGELISFEGHEGEKTVSASGATGGLTLGSLNEKTDGTLNATVEVTDKATLKTQTGDFRVTSVKAENAAVEVASGSLSVETMEVKGESTIKAGANAEATVGTLTVAADASKKSTLTVTGSLKVEEVKSAADTDTVINVGRDDAKGALTIGSAEASLKGLTFFLDPPGRRIRRSPTPRASSSTRPTWTASSSPVRTATS